MGHERAMLSPPVHAHPSPPGLLNDEEMMASLQDPHIARHMMQIMSVQEYELVFNQMITNDFYNDDLNRVFEVLENTDENRSLNGNIRIEE